MRRAAFTLVELLVVVSIIGVLLSLAMPSMTQARQAAKSVQCLANLHSVGHALACYQSDNRDLFMDTVRQNYPDPGRKTYFWGTTDRPVDRSASWFMSYLAGSDQILNCPMLPWGSYVPQAGVIEPTTTYGYNGWCLNPDYWNRVDANNQPLPQKRSADIRQPAQLFVFADSGMYWAPAGVKIFQNSTSLDPVATSWGPNTTPTTHFRHFNQTNALTVDGHAQSYSPEGGIMRASLNNLGFVGAANDPHYDQ